MEPCIGDECAMYLDYSVQLVREDTGAVPEKIKLSDKIKPPCAIRVIGFAVYKDQVRDTYVRKLSDRLPGSEP